jgi:Calx-beta domain/Domain of unknown function (DUF4114)/RTX calcium-binding nonapeptide repeat (4 copies)/von Willebrand factor type A domain
MNINDILRKTIITGFSRPDKERIIAAMRTAYTKSPTAEAMFNNWISRPGKTIYIASTDRDNNSASNNEGIVYIDPSSFNRLNYINNYGKAVRYTLLGGLIHEFGHALSGKEDPAVRRLGDRLTDYQSTNIPFVNDIWSELTRNGVPGLDLMISYTGTATDEYQKLGFAYTENQPIIDTAINVDFLRRNEAADRVSGWSTIGLGMSKDLLIGGSRNNTLESGADNDFLFGGGGDDELKGGAGIDTAIYFGKKSDYDVSLYRNFLGFADGSWTVSHVRGARDIDGDLINYAGTDRIENIEVLQFDDGKEYLRAGGISSQSDIAFVIDTTASVGLSISGTLNYIQHQASTIVDAIYANNQDARVGIVAFKDTHNGEPSQVILPFTEQVEFADRKSAAIAAIDSLTASGGGDTPETAFDGLRLALNGALGQWRPGAGTIRVVLFTNSSVKDYEIANEVSELAHNIGATVGSSSTEVLPGGYIDTYGLSLGNSSGGVPNERYCDHSDDYCCNNTCYLTGETTNIPFVPSNEPIEIVPTIAQVQIFTIFTGPADTNTKALEAIANANGGTFQTADTNEDLLKKLIAIVGAPRVEPTQPSVAVIATDPGAAETTTGETANPGKFLLTRTGDLSQSLTVAYTLSGNATNGSDYQNLTGTVTFEAGKDRAIVNVNILDDNIAEGIETVTLTLAANPQYTLDPSNADTIFIFDNELQPTQLIQPTANSLEIAGDAASALLKFTKVSSTGNNKNEIAAFVVDDERGSIDGILPGDKNYLAAAIARSQTIFSSLGDSPLDRQFDRDSQRFLNVYSGDLMQFLLIADDTLDSVRAKLDRGEPISNVVFSLPTANPNAVARSQLTALSDNGGYQLAWSDKLADEKTSLDRFENWIVNVETSDNYPAVAGTDLQGKLAGEVIDLRSFRDRPLTIDFSTASDALYNNFIGLYAVEDELGTLANGLKPSDVGYAEVAIKSAILRSSKNETKSGVTVTGGKILAPVIIANSSFDEFLKLDSQERSSNNIHAYFNYLGANADKVDHFRLLGDNKFGVEDLYGGGDRDYNDIVFQLTVKN